MKIILCGYHWTGCRVLEHLLGRGDVTALAVFTHADPPGHVPDLFALAKEKGVWVSGEDVSRARLPFQPDIVVSVYYRQIIRPNVIEACGGKIFNMHPSLLPRHRGCSSIPWAMIEGDTVTGVTFHYIDRGVDTGKVILQAAVPIHSDDTQKALFERCMETGVAFWPAALELVKAGFAGVEQRGEGSYHRRGAPFDGEIDPAWDEQRVERFIRAMTFPPYPCAQFRGREIRTLQDYMDARFSVGAGVAGSLDDGKS